MGHSWLVSWNIGLFSGSHPHRPSWTLQNWHEPDVDTLLSQGLEFEFAASKFGGKHLSWWRIWRRIYHYSIYSVFSQVVFSPDFWTVNSSTLTKGFWKCLGILRVSWDPTTYSRDLYTTYLGGCKIIHLYYLYSYYRYHWTSQYHPPPEA